MRQSKWVRRLRFWLIRKLAMGDSIALNCDFGKDGVVIRVRGSALVCNCTFRCMEGAEEEREIREAREDREAATDAYWCDDVDSIAEAIAKARMDEREACCGEIRYILSTDSVVGGVECVEYVETADVRGALGRIERGEHRKGT